MNKSASALGSLWNGLTKKNENKMPEAVAEDLMLSLPGKTDTSNTTIYFSKHGNIYSITPDPTMDLHKRLPAAVFLVKFHPQMGFYLEATDNFDIPKVLYGNTGAQADRILSTFKDRKHTTGVLLVGEQGSGKTLLAKLISSRAIEADIPTLIVNAPYIGDAFNSFLASIHQPTVVLFDEFEKVYDKDAQPHLLTMLDGVFGGKKLYMMTANDKWKIDSHLKNRPGRFFYLMEFRGVSKEFVEQYCERNLKDKSKLDGILSISGMFQELNFDMLQAMVEEVNRYGESPIAAMEFLNVKPVMDYQESYMYSLKVDGKEIDLEKLGDDEPRWEGNPFGPRKISIQYIVEKKELDEESGKMEDASEWKRAVFSVKNLASYDPKKGIIHLKNDKNESLTLVREDKAADFDYKRLLAL